MRARRVAFSRSTAKSMVVALLVGLLSVPFAAPPVAASDHREAPMISLDASLDITDVYSFVFPGNTGVSPSGALSMVGTPVDPGTFGDTNVVVELDQDIPDPVPPMTAGIELTALNLLTPTPIVVSFPDESTEQWDVEISVSSSSPPAGLLDLFPTSPDGGQFFMDILLTIDITFRRTSDGEERPATKDLGASDASGSFGIGPVDGLLSIPDVTTPLILGYDAATGQPAPFGLFSPSTGSLITLAPTPAPEPPSADVSVEIGDQPNQGPNGPRTRVEVENTGPDDATGVVLTFRYPPGLAPSGGPEDFDGNPLPYDFTSAPDPDAPGGTVVTVQLGAVPVGLSLELFFGFQPPKGADFQVTAEVGAAEPDPDLENNARTGVILDSSSTVVTVFPADATISVGDTVGLTAFGGPGDDQGNPDLGDDGDPGTDDDAFISVDADWYTDDSACSVDPTSGPTTTVTGQQAGDCQVTATMAGFQGVANIFVLALPSSADVSVEIRGITQRPNGPRAWFEVRNDGTDDATGVVLTFRYPPGLVPFNGGRPEGSDNHSLPVDFASAPDPDAPGGTVVTVQLGDFPVGMSLDIFFGFEPPRGADFQITAEVRAAEPDPDLDNNDSTVTILPSYDTYITPSPGDATIAIGDTEDLTAFGGPGDDQGNPDLGDDGVPGTGDDQFIWVDPEDWSADDPACSVDPTSGPTTTVTGQQAGECQVTATMAGFQGVAVVTVVADLSLRYLDSAGEEAVEIRLYEPSRARQNLIRGAQELYVAFQELCERYSGHPFLEAFYCGLRDAVAAALQSLVPTGARYTVAGADLGNGDVPATMTSFDADGDPIEQYEIILASDGDEVRSDPWVAVRTGGRIRSGTYGKIHFFFVDENGIIKARADGYVDAEAPIGG